MCYTGYDSFRDGSVRVHTGILGKRDYFSQFAKQMPPLCATLPRQEFVFAALPRFHPPFPFPLTSTPSSSTRLAMSSRIFFLPLFSPVYTSPCTRSRLFANTHDFSTSRPPPPIDPSGTCARAFVDTRRHTKRANPRTPGAAYFNQLAYVHCLPGVPVSLRYTSRNNDRTQQHPAPPSILREKAKRP